LGLNCFGIKNVKVQRMGGRGGSWGKRGKEGGFSGVRLKRAHLTQEMSPFSKSLPVTGRWGQKKSNRGGGQHNECRGEWKGARKMPMTMGRLRPRQSIFCECI